MDRDAAQWLDAFSAGLAAGDIAAVLPLFAEDCYWRDLLSFTWNIKTMEGRGAIAAMLAETLTPTQPSAWELVGPPEVSGAVTEVWLRFQTATAWGSGRLRLQAGLCHTLLTTIRDLKGHEVAKGPLRPKGVAHKADRQRESWSEARARGQARLGLDEQPYCLIIGGGQGGLALAARLKQLGVPTLIVEKSPRAGDSWRNRYRSLVLHDPVWYDHMPFLPFPETWPVFTAKDKMGDWLEAYARIFELDLWTSTTCDAAHYDAARGEWTVRLTRDGRTTTLHARQLVFATGAYGPPRRMNWPGAADFGGIRLHSSDYTDGRAYVGKRCVVIGAGSSAHDIAVDLWEAGAEVTMLQRSATIVVRSETLMDLAFDAYSEAALARGITTETADMLGAAMPYALFADQQKGLYRTIRARDAAFYERLAGASFAHDFGEDDSGLMMRALRTASGYYIDVGASDLIARGEIRVISADPVARLTPGGIGLASGREVASDVIIECTGFQSMNETVASVVSRQVADAVGPCWGLGSGVPGDPGPWQGELRNMWKPTAQEALWFHGGNLALSRFYSGFVALQIKARMERIATPVYQPPVCHSPAPLAARKDRNVCL